MASRYTDYTTPDPVYQKSSQKFGINFTQNTLLYQYKDQGTEAVRQEVAVYEYFEKCKRPINTLRSQNVETFVTYHTAHVATAVLYSVKY